MAHQRPKRRQLLKVLSLEGSPVYTIGGRTYRTPIKTLRGDYRALDGSTGNRPRRWERCDFSPREEDIFEERLYAIQWIKRQTLEEWRQETFFAAVTKMDEEQERRIEELVRENLSTWQKQGVVPDMEIESGDKTDEPIRTRGWTHWHHMVNARQLLVHSIIRRASTGAESALLAAKGLDYCSRLCRWDAGHAGSSPQAMGTFTNQALAYQGAFPTFRDLFLNNDRNATCKSSK